MSNKRLVLTVFLSAGVLTWIILESLTRQIAASFRLATRFPGAEVGIVVLPVLLAATLSIFLMRNARTSEFMNEVVVELKKVSWPQRKELYATTVVAIVFMLIAGVILGLFDSVWAMLFRMIV